MSSKENQLEKGAIKEVTITDSGPSQESNTFFDAFRALFVWYPSTLEKDERKLLVKLDVSILIYACLSYFVKTLDTKNLSNAYVSGMKEDLGMMGNELNWLNITYQMGYVVGQIPLTLLLTRPKISKYVLPTLEVIYGVLTILQSRVTTVDHLYVLRFFSAFFEAPTYAATHYILGRWYSTEPTKTASGKTIKPQLYARTAVYFMSYSAGNMISGHLQAAAHTNLSGVHGHSGWQWLFIIDGIFTLGVSIIGFVIFPGIPESGKPLLFTEKEYELVQERLKQNGITESKKIDWNLIKRTFSDWKWYFFVLNYTLMVIVWYPIAYFNLWLKAQDGKYTVNQINQYPTVCDAIGIFVSFFGVALAAAYPHWILYSISTLGPLVGTLIMSIYNVPDGAVFFAFYISYLINVDSPLLYAFVSVVLKHDSEQKAFIVSSMMTVAQFTNNWLALAIFPTAAKNHHRAAPEWNIGWPICVVLCAIMISTYVFCTWLHEREKKLGIAFKSQEQIENIDNVSTSEDVESQSTIRKRTYKTEANEVHSNDL